MSLDAKRLREVRAHFDRLLDLDPVARGDALRQLAEADDGLAAEIEAMLRRDAALAGAPTRTALDDFAVAVGSSEPATPMVGRRIGVYTVTGVLGSGGMGLVLAAERSEGDLRQQVAIKLVRNELLAPALLRRFSTERAVLAALDHPAICRFLDAGTLDEGTPYVVMERVTGRGLLDWCDSRQLGIAARVALFRQLVDAVAHAHRRLVVHRDIKPANVLVSDDGQPKLLDFGIAKSLSDERPATVTAERFFTPGHAAPELLRGDGVSVACDIYGLGTVLYELLAGRPPFVVSGLGAAEIERLIKEVPPPSLASAVTESEAAAQAHGARSVDAWRAALRGDLDAVVQRCLRKEPSARYLSAEQLDADLLAWLSQRPVSARGGATGYRVRKFVRRNLAAVLTVALGTTAAVAAGVGFTLQALDVRLQRDRAEQALGLLRDAFVEADPARASGTAVTAREILAQATERLNALRAEYPELFVDLATTLSDVYLALGEPARAEELTGHAVEDWRRVHAGEPIPESLRTLRGSALSDLRRVDELAVLLAEAQEAGHSGPELDLLRARQASLNGDSGTAVALIERVLEALEGASPRDDVALRARRMHVDALVSDGRFEDALASFEAALTWQRTVLPSDHPEVIRTRLLGPTVFRRLERFDEALAEAMEVERLIKGSYGTKNTNYAVALSGLAQAQGWVGRREESVANYRAAVELWETLTGPGHQNTLRARYNLARALLQAPEHRAEGLSVLTALVSSSDRHLGPGHALSGFFRLALADNLLQDGNAIGALDHLAGAAGRASYAGARGANRSDHLRIATRAARSVGCADASDRTGPSAPVCADFGLLVASEPAP